MQINEEQNVNTNTFDDLPEELCATKPPEARGKGRDDVRLLVIAKEDGKYTHAKFNELSNFLSRSDSTGFQSQ